MLFKKTPKNQTDIRTKNDIVSYLLPYQQRDKDSELIEIPSKTNNPIFEHKTERLNDMNNIKLGSGINNNNIFILKNKKMV